jgi:hypothetical protein
VLWRRCSISRCVHARVCVAHTSVKDVSMWEQLSLAAFLQRYWADNQVCGGAGARVNGTAF